MKEVRPASTVKVFRVHPQNGLEILLLRRNTKLSFASGFWVFPGGKIEPEEIAAHDTEVEAARVAGVRETFEESNLQIQLNSLKYFIRWTTPLPSKIRFRTYFFHTLIPYDQSDVQVDDSEILEHKWLTAQNALDAAQRREVLLLPPTFVSLQRILGCNTYQQVSDEWNKTKPMEVEPTIAVEGSKMHCIYEGDDAYGSSDFSKGLARHRLIADQTNGNFEFMYQHCDHVFPLNGRR